MGSDEAEKVVGLFGYGYASCRAVDNEQSAEHQEEGYHTELHDSADDHVLA